MPVHLSAKKRLRQARKANLRNLKIKSELKSLTRKVEQSKDQKEASDNFKKVQSLLDKAARIKVIHKNKSSSQKGKLARLVSQKSKT